MLNLEVIKSDRSANCVNFYRTVQMEDLWHEEAKRNTRLSKNGKPMTSRRVIAKIFGDGFPVFHEAGRAADCLTNYLHNKAAGVTSPPLCCFKEPVLSSAWLTASLLTATATLFFTLAPLTFTLLTLAILLSALLSGGGRSARLVWIMLCVHDAFFIIELGVWVVRTSRNATFSIKSP